MSSVRQSFALRVPAASWVAGLLWCAAALSAGYWFWLFPQGPQPVHSTVVSSATQAVPASATQLPRALGLVSTESVSTPDASRLSLLGVIAGPNGQGSALIALDGQPPKPFRVGQTVSDGLVLQSLGPRRALLGAAVDGPALRELQLPVLQAP
jgi:general secretion pathway protein C